MREKKKHGDADQRLIGYIKESSPTAFIKTAGLIASVFMVIIVGWYAWETHKLANIAEKNLESSERQIKLSRKPSLSLGFTNEDKFAEHIKGTDYLTGSQVGYFLETAKTRKAGLFFNIQNFSRNDAYYVYLISYDADTKVFYRSYFLFNQIPAGQREITYFEAGPVGEKDIEVDLKNIYSRSVLKELKEKGMLKPDDKAHNLILLYLDNENGLYALTRYVFTHKVDGKLDLSLPKYYELGSGK